MSVKRGSAFYDNLRNCHMCFSNKTDDFNTRVGAFKMCVQINCSALTKNTDLVRRYNFNSPILLQCSDSLKRIAAKINMFNLNNLFLFKIQNKLN